jgi:hypothetical protein
MPQMSGTPPAAAARELIVRTRIAAGVLVVLAWTVAAGAGG